MLDGFTAYRARVHLSVASEPVIPQHDVGELRVWILDLGTKRGTVKGEHLPPKVVPEMFFILTHFLTLPLTKFRLGIASSRPQTLDILFFLGRIVLSIELITFLEAIYFATSSEQSQLDWT